MNRRREPRKQIINDIYTSPMGPALKNHIINDLGFSEEDQAIIKSLMEHNAPSGYHYDATGINRERFERRLGSINRVVFPELVRLANLQQNNSKPAAQ